MKINGLYLEEKTPDAVLGGCIEIFERAWPIDPRRTIADIETECAKPDNGVYWQRAPTFGDGPYQNARTNLMLDLTGTANLSQSPVVQTTHNMFYSTILSASNSYAKRFNIGEPLFHEGYQLLKYNGGQEYKAHYDSTTSIGRCMTAICYLNDDYEGGEIEFLAICNTRATCNIVDCTIKTDHDTIFDVRENINTCGDDKILYTFSGMSKCELQPSQQIHQVNFTSTITIDSTK